MHKSNNAQINNAKDIDAVMPMYNLIEYGDDYSKTSGSLWLWQHCRDEPFLDANGSIANFPACDDNSALFNFKTKIAGRIENEDTKDLKMMVPLKYLSNFWRILEMPLIICEINLILTWFANFFIIDASNVNQVDINLTQID